MKPVLWIVRRSEGGDEQVLFKSPDEGFGLMAKWADFSINMQALCNGDYYRPLTVREGYYLREEFNIRTYHLFP